MARREARVMGLRRRKSNRTESEKRRIKGRNEQDKLVPESKRRSGGGVVLKEGDR